MSQYGEAVTKEVSKKLPVGLRSMNAIELYFDVPFFAII